MWYIIRIRILWRIWWVINYGAMTHISPISGHVEKPHAWCDLSLGWQNPKVLFLLLWGVLWREHFLLLFSIPLLELLNSTLDYLLALFRVSRWTKIKLELQCSPTQGKNVVFSKTTLGQTLISDKNVTNRASYRLKHGFCDTVTFIQ